MAGRSEVELSSSQATLTMSIWRGSKNYNTCMEHLSFQENENIEEPIVGVTAATDTYYLQGKKGSILGS